MTLAAAAWVRQLVDLADHVGRIDQGQRQSGRGGDIPIGDVEIGIGRRVLGHRDVHPALLRGPSSVKDVVVESDLGTDTRDLDTLLPLLVQVPYKRSAEAPCPECGHKTGLMPHRHLDVTGGQTCQ